MLLVSSACAASDKPTLLESGRCRFKLYGYEMAKPVERAIVFGIERVFETYQNTFGFDLPEDLPVNITIFADQPAFMAYQKHKTGLSITKTGYYDPRYKETVVWQNKDAKTMLSIIFHESSHVMLGDQIPFVPSWLNEGLAVYFEGMNVIGSNKRIYLEKVRQQLCLYWLKKGFPIPLPEYLAMTRKEWLDFRAKDSDAAYTIGYSLIYYMMATPKNQAILKELLQDFKKQGYRADSIAVINKFYPGQIARLEENWIRWIPKAKKYRHLRAFRTHKQKLKAKQ